MDFKKILFPIGAGDDIEPRIYGALRVAKWFGAHMEILACQMDPGVVYNMKMTLRGGVLFDEFLRSAKADLLDEQKQNEALFKLRFVCVSPRLPTFSAIENSSVWHPQP